jgi:hypothetical protein
MYRSTFFTNESRRMRIRTFGTVAVLVLALVATGACKGKTATGGGPATAGDGGGQGGIGAPSVTASPILADGDSPVFLTKVNPSARTITFDLIQFLTGDAATKEYKKEHPTAQEGPPDDYLIVNDNPKLRTLPVGTNVTCTVVDTATSGVSDKPIAFADLPGYFTSHDQNGAGPAGSVYWLTVAAGQIVKIREQFVP